MAAAHELVGRVVVRPFGTGTKSEHTAVMLETERGLLVLRRAGGNAFRDPALEALVGRRIRASGRLTGYTFLMAGWKDEEE